MYLDGEKHCERKVSCTGTQRYLPGEARTRTSRSGGEHANHDATAPPLANQKEGVLFQANQVSPATFSALRVFFHF